MGKPLRLLVCSDIHYACLEEKKRVNYELKSISNPLQRLFVRFYRRYFWLRDPFAHNELLHRVLNPPFEPDVVIANGDYSCDSAFIGVADPASLQSAQECLTHLRDRFGPKFMGVMGDHELGKISLFGEKGGLRLESLRLAQEKLGLLPIWTRRYGRYVFIAVTSTLAAMPVYEREAPEPERAQWREHARQHAHGIAAAFDALHPSDRVLLFCHDPTALPFLGKIDAVRSRVHQIERTIIGHLHSPVILNQSRILSGLPRLTFGGSAVRRMSAGLARAKEWQPFNILLCPSPAGIELTRRGGFYSVMIDPEGNSPAAFQLHPIER